jgi:hypothetical protein
VWSVCYGGSYSAAQLESCNGLDDDCDGVIDENCECFGGETQKCSSNVGVCKQGVQNCVNGSWGVCEGGVEAGIEICGNLLDDDCDGMVDYEDDNCESQKVVIENETVEEEVECYDDRDCEEGYECDRNMCIKKEVEVKTSSSENASKASDWSNLGEQKEETSLMGYLIPIVIIILVGLLIALVFFKKKTVREVGVGAEKIYKPYIPFTKNNKIKSKIEKDLEISFKQSKDLFRK